MLDCARIKGPCSVKPVPDPPPCPPPPPPPVPWIYVWVIATFFSAMGLIYKIYLYMEERERLSENVAIWRPRGKVKRPFHCDDLPACVQYLIVGAGAAGWAAYRAIAEHDANAKVFFISKEDTMPYRRPPMSKNMWWNPDPPNIQTLNYIEEGKRLTMYLSECLKFLDAVKFYRKKTGPAVSIATGWCVLRVDADDHVVYVKTMCGERPIYYERCLLAPGSKAKQLSMIKSAPKKVRDRVTTFRTIRDLEIAYRKVKDSKHVTIIGGGCLGCELAWTLGRMTQVYDAFESKDGRLELTLSNGSSIVTDYAFVCIGAKPRMDLAEPSFLEQDDVNGGFLVNTELEARTHLYVAGDAASFYSQWKDTRMRFEHYINAEEQGYIAGANMTGYWTPCNMEPHYWFRLGHALEVEVVGEVGACMPTVGLFKQCPMDQDAKKELALQIKEAGNSDIPCFKTGDEYRNIYKRGLLFYLRDETVVGMLFWNIPRIEDRKEVVTEMLRSKPTYKDINLLAELLGFPETQCVYLPAEEKEKDPVCLKRREF